MSSAAAWGNNPTNGFSGFTNQGFPAEQNNTIIWHPQTPTAGAPTTGPPTARAPTTGAPTAGAPTAGAPTNEAPTAGAPTGITVVVNTDSWRYQKPSLKLVGTFQIICGLVFLVFGIVFLTNILVPLDIGFLILNCVTHFLAGYLSIASPQNNPDSSKVKYSVRVSVLSVVATAILIIILIFDLIHGFGYKCNSVWDFNCMEIKNQLTAIRGFLMVFSLFACFLSMIFLGYKIKGCCPEPMGSMVSVPPAQSASSSMPTAFQAGQQGSMVSVPPAQSASSSMPTAFQAGQQNPYYSNYPNMNMNSKFTEDPPSYNECVQTGL